MAEIRTNTFNDELVTLATDNTGNVEIQVAVQRVPERPGRRAFNGVNVSGTGTMTVEKTKELILMLETAIAFAEGRLELPAK